MYYSWITRVLSIISTSYLRHTLKLSRTHKGLSWKLTRRASTLKSKVSRLRSLLCICSALYACFLFSNFLPGTKALWQERQWLIIWWQLNITQVDDTSINNQCRSVIANAFWGGKALSHDPGPAALHSVTGDSLLSFSKPLFSLLEAQIQCTYIP